MISMLAILLYLQLIAPNNSYSTSYINQLQFDNNRQITQIQSDSSWNAQVQQQYDPPAQTVVIFPEERE
jgi:hypothetical protein